MGKDAKAGQRQILIRAQSEKGFREIDVTLDTTQICTYDASRMVLVIDTSVI